MPETIALLVLALALPTAFGYAVIGVRVLHRRYRASRPALPTAQPIEKLWRDLRRLHDQLEDVENAPADMPSKHARCVATRAAYLDALDAACIQLEIAAPVGRPVPDSEIYRVEVELRRCGLDVRPVG